MGGNNPVQQQKFFAIGPIEAPAIHENAADFEKSWADATDGASSGLGDYGPSPAPEYRHPKKNWRVKQAAMPNWYKAHAGVRTKALSGAARVARCILASRPFQPPHPAWWEIEMTRYLIIGSGVAGE